MRIQKRTPIEIFFPLVVFMFLGIGTSFVDAIDAANLRWIFVFILFFYLFLNKKILVFANLWWKLLLLVYLIWCMATTLWSEVPILSFSKGIMFCVNVVTMFSIGSLWVVKFGFKKSFNWQFLILMVLVLLSGFLGAYSASSEDSFGYFSAYSGMAGNPNGFGFLVAIVAPLILLRLYYQKTNKWLLFFWLVVLLIDVRFLVLSYSRGDMVIFLSILSFFLLSLPLSKKIFSSLLLFFTVLIVLIMTPVSYLETIFVAHFEKFGGNMVDSNTSRILETRSLVWEKSYEQAIKGGIIGGGFAVTIGDNHFVFTGLANGNYGREKGNSQFAILEETGLVGFVLYVMMLISFFAYVIPYYRRLMGSDKVAMGLTLGAICGLLVESLVEGWWDSAAAPEGICFWMFVGIAYGMVYLQKRKLNTEVNLVYRDNAGM